MDEKIRSYLMRYDTFKVSSISSLRDGGTIQVIISQYDDLSDIYVHQNDKTFHNGYPPSNTNVIKRENFKDYLLFEIDRFIAWREEELRSYKHIKSEL